MSSCLITRRVRIGSSGSTWSAAGNGSLSSAIPQPIASRRPGLHAWRGQPVGTRRDDSASYRLPTGGRIDRSRPCRLFTRWRSDERLSWRHVGLCAVGERGDGSSAAASNTTGPAGFCPPGVEEPNGLFTLGEGGRSEPNVAGTVTELTRGPRCAPSECLAVGRIRSEWPSTPSPRRCSRPGFYYKTFMGPDARRLDVLRALHPPRRRPGAGRSSARSRSLRDATRVCRCAGHRRRTGGAGGCTRRRLVPVRACDCRAGLSCWVAACCSRRVASPVEEWRREVEAELESLAHVTILRRTIALGVYDGDTVALVERRDHLRPRPRRRRGAPGHDHTACARHCAMPRGRPSGRSYSPTTTGQA